MISRRKFFQMLGAAAVTTAAGLMVPDVGRKIFLPPKGGWNTERYAKLQVGDIISIEGVTDLKVRRCKLFTVTSVDQPRDDYRYDAVWTRPNGEEIQYGVEMCAPAGKTSPDVQKHLDQVARSVLERRMRVEQGTPNVSTHFRLQLPTSSIVDARWI